MVLYDLESIFILLVSKTKMSIKNMFLRYQPMLLTLWKDN